MRPPSRFPWEHPDGFPPPSESRCPTRFRGIHCRDRGSAFQISRLRPVETSATRRTTDRRCAAPRTVSCRAPPARAEKQSGANRATTLGYGSPSADGSRNRIAFAAVSNDAHETVVPAIRNRMPAWRHPVTRRGTRASARLQRTIVARSLASAGAVQICPLLSERHAARRGRYCGRPAFSQLLWRASGDRDGPHGLARPRPDRWFGFGIRPHGSRRCLGHKSASLPSGVNERFRDLLAVVSGIRGYGVPAEVGSLGDPDVSYTACVHYPRHCATNGGRGEFSGKRENREFVPG